MVKGYRCLHNKKASLPARLSVLLIVGCLFFCWRGFRISVSRSINQLYDRHWRCIARSWAGFQNSQVAARAILETRSKIIEQLADRFLVAQAVESETAMRLPRRPPGIHP